MNFKNIQPRKTGQTQKSIYYMIMLTGGFRIGKQTYHNRNQVSNGPWQGSDRGTDWESTGGKLLVGTAMFCILIGIVVTGV